MNNNSIEFTKKYLKYKHKYITLRDQSFLTYDTKIKQIGGEGEFVCMPDTEGGYTNSQCTDHNTSPLSAQPPPPLSAQPPPPLSAQPPPPQSPQPPLPFISELGKVKLKSHAKSSLAPPPAKSQPPIFAALAKRRKGWTHGDDSDDSEDEDGELPDDNQQTKYLKYKYKYITLKNQLFV